MSGVIVNGQDAVPTTLRALPAETWLRAQLAQLERLVGLQGAHGEQLNAQGQRLLAHAIFATYVDCREAGAEAAAAAVLIGARPSPASGEGTDA